MDKKIKIDIYGMDRCNGHFLTRRRFDTWRMCDVRQLPEHLIQYLHLVRISNDR